MGQILKLFCLLFAGLVAAPAVAEFDPTVPPKIRAAAERPSEATLSWVRVNGKNSIAWYNGAIVTLGDKVEGGRVVAIQEDHIVIAGRGSRRTVFLLDPHVQHKTVKPSPPERRQQD